MLAHDDEVGIPGLVRTLGNGFRHLRRDPHVTRALGHILDALLDDLHDGREEIADNKQRIGEQGSLRDWGNPSPSRSRSRHRRTAGSPSRSAAHVRLERISANRTHKNRRMSRTERIPVGAPDESTTAMCR